MFSSLRECDQQKEVNTKNKDKEERREKPSPKRFFFFLRGKETVTREVWGKCTLKECIKAGLLLLLQIRIFHKGNEMATSISYF